MFPRVGMVARQDNLSFPFANCHNLTLIVCMNIEVALSIHALHNL